MLEAFISIQEALPYLIEGALVTLGIVSGAMFLGLILGVPMALWQVYGGRKMRTVTGLYVWFFRGVPVLVLLYLFYFGLFSILDINLGTFASAVLVLGLTSAAYQSQIFRGSIMSLPIGQLKAASALGMSDARAVFTIILPQALRLSIPGWSNEYSIILKDSAVAFVLGTTEIMARAHFVASRTYQHLPLYLTAGVLYFVLTYLGVRALRELEKKARIPGYSHQG
ncbi:MAG: amino acid ABC transporter permease [Thermodesulfobacteriota bacterium]